MKDALQHRRNALKHVAAVVASLVSSLLSPMANAIEEPKYTVVRQYDGFEVREYAPYLVAEVVVPGPAEDAGNQGFRILAGYIFGRNRGERKIPMTAPVAQAPAPVEMNMAAPLTQSPSGERFIVQFTMPREYTLETLPEPLDPEIKVKELPGGRYAVTRFSGAWSSGNYTDHLQQLERAVDAAGLRTTGSPIYSRYNAPFVPWFLRRNEIWLRLV